MGNWKEVLSAIWTWSFLLTLGKIALILFLAWIFFRWKRRFEGLLRSKKKLDPMSIEILGKIFSAIVLAVAALIFLRMVGLDIDPLLAFGGIGAAALGFASRDAIANLYGGGTLYLTRPFVVGDKIEIPEKALLGTIEKVGWYFTTLRDNSKKPVYIPNSIFATQLLINESRMTHRYIDEKLRLRYSDADKIDSLIRAIRQMLLLHSGIDTGQSINVFLHDLAESAIVLEIRAYTLTTSYGEFMEIRQEILLRICKQVEEAGIGIGYPIHEQISRV